MGKFIIIGPSTLVNIPNMYMSPVSTSVEGFGGGDHCHTIRINTPDQFIKSRVDPLDNYLSWYNITHHVPRMNIDLTTIQRKVWSVNEISGWIEDNIENDVLAQRNMVVEVPTYHDDSSSGWILHFTGGYKQKVEFEQWFNTVKTVHSYTFKKEIFEQQFVEQWLKSNSTDHRIINDYNYYYVQFPFSNENKAAEFVLVFGHYFN